MISRLENFCIWMFMWFLSSEQSCVYDTSLHFQESRAPTWMTVNLSVRCTGFYASPLRHTGFPLKCCQLDSENYNKLACSQSKCSDVGIVLLAICNDSHHEVLLKSIHILLKVMISIANHMGLSVIQEQLHEQQEVNLGPLLVQLFPNEMKTGKKFSTIFM